MTRPGLAWLLAAVLMGVCGGSWAGVTLSKFPPNPGVLPGGGWKFTQGTTFGNPPPPRAWVDGNYGSPPAPAAIATDAIVLAGPAGNLPVSVVQRVSVADVAVAAASLLVPQVGTVLTAAQLLLSTWRIFNESDSGGGPLMHDPGLAPNTSSSQVEHWASFATNTFDGGGPGIHPDDFPTAVAACNAAAAYGTQYARRGAIRVVGLDYAQFTLHGLVVCNMTDPGNAILSTTMLVTYDTVTSASQCPVSIDALNPAYSVPAGSPVGADGLCPSARYNHVSISPSDIPGLSAGPGFPQAGAIKDAAQQVLNNGGTLPASMTVSGQASQTGSPTTATTVNPDGSQQTVTNTPSYNFDYSHGDAVTYSTTNNTVTQTCVGSGACSSTTTTTTIPGPVLGSTAGTPAPEATGCQLNPSAAGCGGTPAGQPQLYTAKTLTFAQALNSFKDQMIASPLGTAMGGYFAVTGGGVCPSFNAHIPYINFDAVIDQFCSQWATDALAFLKTALLVVAGIVAFRVAAL